MMSFSSTFLRVSLISLWIHSATVSAQKCPDQPVFTPPSLVVRYGQPASAVCSVCKQDCNGTQFSLEHSVGSSNQSGTTISWEIGSLTEWNTGLLCFYNSKNGDQCTTELDITLYQPPDNVTIRFVHGGEPLLAGRSYTLECAVQKVAPVEHLKVTFYKGQERLAQKNSTRGDKKPVDEIFTHNFNVSAEDDGANYWCDAQLELEGQLVPPVESPQDLHATVHYKPRLVSPSSPDTITIKKGQPLKLSCPAVGRPSPSITWTHAGSFSNTSDYSIESVSFGDEGVYTCTVNNSMGSLTNHFTVKVQGDYVGYIVCAVIVGLVLIILVASLIYNRYYKHNYTGRYDFRKKYLCWRKHTPVPTSA